MLAPDLFGGETPLRPEHGPKLAGYPKPPGSGPIGETCRSCKHLAHVQRESGAWFRKCVLAEARWTKGAGTDVKVRSPACSMWEAEE